MRLMVIAALRAATMATTIQRNCFQVGQPWRVNRAASNAPVSAKGSAKMECSNLIISRTARRRVIDGIGMQVFKAEHSEFSEKTNTDALTRCVTSCLGF